MPKDASPAPPPKIFHYLDYRDWLRDWFSAWQAGNRARSHEMFARKAGLASKGTLHNIMSGKRTPNEATARAISTATELNEDEHAFLLLLIELEQAQSIADRRRVMEAILNTTTFRQSVVLDDRPGAVMDSYLRSWPCVVIRELSRLPDFQPTPDWIAQRLVMTLSPDTIAEALQTLRALGLIEEDTQGALRASTIRVVTPQQTTAEAIFTYHHNFLHLAHEALDTVPSAERHFEAGTLLLTDDLLAEIKAELGQLLPRLAAAADGQAHAGQRVYQLQLQLFPLTKIYAPPSAS